MKPHTFRSFVLTSSFVWAALGMAAPVWAAPVGKAKAAPAATDEIKAYCLDFNWAPTHRCGKSFAKPGLRAAADPAVHMACYKTMGAIVIQILSFEWE